MNFKSLVFFAILCPFAISAQAFAELQEKWKQFLADKDLKNASVSFSVRDVGDGKLVFSHEPNKSLSPASSLKLLTTAACYGILGKDFRFETEVFLVGKISNDTLFGDLVLEGSGDPTLGSERMGLSMDTQIEAIAVAFQKTSLKCLVGDVVVRGKKRIENPIPPYWSWTDMGNYYGAGVWPVNFAENLYSITFKVPNQEGLSASIVSVNPKPNIEIENYVTAGPPNSGDQSYVFTSPFSQKAIITGTLPADKPQYTIKGAITDPHAMVKSLLKEKIMDKGVVFLDSKNSNVDPKSKTKLFNITSPKLSEIIRFTNQKSINIFAEALLLALDSSTNKSTVSYESAVKAMLGYFSKLGLSTEGVNIYDGSGLSASNSLPSGFVTEALVKIAKTSYFNEYFNTLAVAGRSGTLARLCKGTAAENNLRGKSGNINNVTTYCGYVTNKEGKLLAFSFMVNNFSVPNGQMIAKMEKILVAMAE